MEARLFPTLRRWLDARFSPCLSDAARLDSEREVNDAAVESLRWSQSPKELHLQQQQQQVKVFFYHPGTNSSKEGAVRRLWGTVATSLHCFDFGPTQAATAAADLGVPPAPTLASTSMEFMYAGLPEAVASRHPDGPCAQFFAMLSLLRGKCDYALVMEPDALPVAQGWLQALARDEIPPRTDASTLLSGRNRRIEGGSGAGAAAGCPTFWVKGSVSRCEGSYGAIDARKDLHINGNALLCLGDDGFHDFIERVSAWEASVAKQRNAAASPLRLASLVSSCK